MKKRKQKRGDFQGSRINPRNFSAGQVKFYIILIPLAVFMILPVIMLINRAFMPLGELFAFPPHIIAHSPTMNNFKSLFALSSTTGVPMLRYLLNSVLVTLMTVALNLVITILVHDQAGSLPGDRHHGGAHQEHRLWDDHLSGLHGVHQSHPL